MSANRQQKQDWEKRVVDPRQSRHTKSIIEAHERQNVMVHELITVCGH